MQGAGLILLLLCSLGLSSSAAKHKIFISVASDSLSGNAFFERETHFMIQQQNTSTHKIQLAWHKLDRDIAGSSWTAFISITLMLPDMRDSSIMDSVYVGAYGFLALAINPHTAGHASVSYEVWNTAFPTQRDTLYWFVSANRMSEIDAEQPPFTPPITK
jgi:hypothetical protein